MVRRSEAAQMQMPSEDDVKAFFAKLGLEPTNQSDTEALPPLPPDYLLNPPMSAANSFETRTSNVSHWDVKAQSRNA